MLGDYSGTVILISHDRDFLDRVVDAVVVPDDNGRWVEYAGGYSDMLAQRGADVPLKASAPINAHKPGRRTERASAANPQRRLSFHQQHALKTLPDAIAQLERSIRALQQRLDDATLYARDRKAFEKVSGDLATAQADLAAAEEQWLQLEMLREDIESS